MRHILPLLLLGACGPEATPPTQQSNDSGGEAAPRCVWSTVVETSGSDWLEDLAVRDDGVLVGVGSSNDGDGEGWVLWVEDGVRTEAHVATGSLNALALAGDGSGWAVGSMVQTSSDADAPALVSIDGTDTLLVEPPIASGELHAVARRDGVTWAGGRHDGSNPVLLVQDGDADFASLDLGSQALGGSVPWGLLPVDEGLLIATRGLWLLEDSELHRVLDSSDNFMDVAEIDDERWAVGPSGTVAVNRGSEWATEQGPSTTAHFYAVWGEAKDDVWVLGSEVWHWDGTSWSQQPDPQDRGSVQAAHALPDGRLVVLSQRDTESAWTSQISVCDPPA